MDQPPARALGRRSVVLGSVLTAFHLLMAAPVFWAAFSTGQAILYLVGAALAGLGVNYLVGLVIELTNPARLTRLTPRQRLVILASLHIVLAVVVVAAAIDAGAVMLYVVAALLGAFGLLCLLGLLP